ncbi:FBN1 [Branchiostoma lanceolatum]|uniref:FBN1 protein n=1 Tax=Branchiostoma lanceolatum TaxID=7740 RepID=A0A8J9ZG70_BRALA|nr:FBN1 [Branchiostoma lanceolatum]
MLTMANTTANLTTPSPTVVNTTANITTPMLTMANTTANLTTPSLTVTLVNTTANITTPMLTMANTTANLTTPRPTVVNTTANITTPMLTLVNTTANLTTPSLTAVNTTVNITTLILAMANTTANLTTPSPSVVNTTANSTTPRFTMANTTANLTTPSLTVTLVNTTANITTPRFTMANTTANLTTPSPTIGNTTANITTMRLTMANTTANLTTPSPTVHVVNTTANITTPKLTMSNTTANLTTPILSVINTTANITTMRMTMANATTNVTTPSPTVVNTTANITTMRMTMANTTANLTTPITTASTPIVTFSTTDLKVIKVSQSQYSEAYPATVDISVTLQKTAGDISSDDINVEATGSCTETCDTNAVCVNQGSSFQCVCNSGYSGDGTSCTDVNECRSAVCASDENSICMNSVGSFSCVCTAGYHKDNGVCVESDRFRVEFLYTSLNYVVKLADTSSTIYVTYTRTYKIEAIHLYLVVGLSSNFLSVSDVTFRSGSLYGGHTLETKKGSTTATQVNSMLQAVLGTSTLFKNVTVQDYDECSNESRNDCFQHSECVNTPGSFTCSCPTGFIDRNLTRPGRTCGMSVTPLVTPSAQSTAQTDTTAGTSTVSAAVGTTKAASISSAAETTETSQTPTFSATDLKVVKVSQSQYSQAYPATVDVSVTLRKTAGNISSDDITEDTLSAALLFTNNGNLEDATVRSSAFATTISDYDLAYLKTYVGQRTSLTLTDLKASNVAVDGNCDSYTHLCLNVTSTNENVQFRTDGDACLQLGSGEGEAGPKNCSLTIGSCTETCDTNAVCVNQGSSFQCVCNSGYSGDGTSCTDVNECESSACASDENSICVNSAGSFSCVCNAGYHKDNGTCIQSDRFRVEYLYTSLDYVAQLANTSSTIYVTYARVYKIEVIHLYLLVGLGSDFLSVSDITFRNGSLYGGHTLETKKGTTTAAQVDSKLAAVVGTTNLFTNVTAQDYDECSDPSRNDCFQHSACVNTPGSYTCTCPTGFIDRNLARPGRNCGVDRLYVALGAIGGALFLFILLLCALQGSKKQTHVSKAKMSFSSKTQQHGPIPVNWRRVDRLNKGTQMTGFSSGGLVWAQDAGKTLWWPARIVSTVNGGTALWVRWYGNGLYSKVKAKRAQPFTKFESMHDRNAYLTIPAYRRAVNEIMKDADMEAVEARVLPFYPPTIRDPGIPPKYGFDNPAFGTEDEFAIPATYYPVDWRRLPMQQFAPGVVAAPNFGRDRMYLPTRDRSQTMPDQSDWFDTLASRPLPPQRPFAFSTFVDQERGYGSQSSRPAGSQTSRRKPRLDENTLEATIDFTYKPGSTVSQTDRSSDTSEESFQYDLDVDEIYFDDDFWEQFPKGPMGQSEA